MYEWMDEVIDKMIEQFHQGLPASEVIDGAMSPEEVLIFSQKLDERLGLGIVKHSNNFIDILAEAIEAFMISVPGDPSIEEREWSSEDMAKSLLPWLSKNGCVKLSEDQEMPNITHDIAALAFELVKEGAEPFTAGAGGMWEAIKQAGFQKCEPLDKEGSSFIPDLTDRVS